MSTTLIIAIVIGAAIIAGLAFYAGQLLYKLKEQNKLIAKKQAGSRTADRQNHTGCYCQEFVVKSHDNLDKR